MVEYNGKSRFYSYSVVIFFTKIKQVKESFNSVNNAIFKNIYTEKNVFN